VIWKVWCVRACCLARGGPEDCGMVSSVKFTSTVCLATTVACAVLLVFPPVIWYPFGMVLVLSVTVWVEFSGRLVNRAF
jgi:hypothetical protein